MSTRVRELPIAGVPPAGRPVRERADAARNRARILAAAERLFAERGVEGVGMDEVAAAAGVGVGTLYRRFGDRAGLAFALLGDREAQLQEAVLRGPAPLGPAAPPADRLCAFLAALVDLLEANTDLYVLSEAGEGGARYRTGLYAFYRLHITVLLRTGRPELDETSTGALADALLAPLGARLYRHQRRQRHLQPDHVTSALRLLAEGLLASPCSPDYD